MKIKPKKTKRKNIRKQLEQSIHKVMRDICLIHEPICVTCRGRHNSQILQAGHLISARLRSTRFDLLNVHTQCRICNSIHRYHPEIYYNWFVQTYGAEELNLLVKQSKKPFKYSLEELKDILQKYKKILAEAK